MTQAELWQLQLLASTNTAEALQGVVTIILLTRNAVVSANFRRPWSRSSLCLARRERHS